MRVARFSVHQNYMASAIRGGHQAWMSNLPIDMVIRDIRFNSASMAYDILFESAFLDDVPEGTITPDFEVEWIPAKNPTLDWLRKQLGEK